MPDTVVTNSPDFAEAKVKRWSTGAVVKALDAPLMVIRGKERFVFTSRLHRTHLLARDAFATSPIIVQRRLRPKDDIRVTVVGDKVFAAEATGVTKLDWRLERRAVKFRACGISSKVESQCRELVRMLGLRFGAIDLVRSNGTTYFLELNPNGEWGWLEAAGLPIAAALVDDLIATTRT